jgi:hypothetical protein
MPNLLDKIAEIAKPGAVADWWAREVKLTWACNPEQEVLDYVDVYTSNDIEQPLRMRSGIVDANNLTPEQEKRKVQYFGNGGEAKHLFANWETHRKVLAHYCFTHPVTIAYEIELYRLTRDVNPAHFVIERAYQLFTGKEMFTEKPISRIDAAIELAIPIVVSRILRIARLGVQSAKVKPPPLDSPLYDLPEQGGGMRIGGRWYTEHALERMAPDTPAIRAELLRRAVDRTRRFGLSEGSEAYNKVLSYFKSKIDPRGVTPSVVEAELLRPGSTNVKVIAVKQKSIVVTVIPKSPGRTMKK